MAYPIITIAREFGSGGHYIGKKVAEALNIPLYDKELITKAAEETGFCEDFIKQHDQQKSFGFFQSFGFGQDSLPMGDQLFVAQSNIIRKWAEEGPCVIVGRCADYILKDYPNLLRVFIYAPMELKVERVKQFYTIPDDVDDIEEYIEDKDDERSEYYEYFAGGDWGSSDTYDISISTAIGMDNVVHVITDLANWKQK